MIHLASHLLCAITPLINTLTPHGDIGSSNKANRGYFRGFEIEVDLIFDDGSTIGSREMLPTTFQKNAQQRMIHHTSTTNSYRYDEEKCSTPCRNKLRLMTV